MKLQRHIHNDKIHYDIIPRTRLVIPLREYEEIRKKYTVVLSIGLKRFTD